jgi:hypothetical protein
MDAGAWVQTKLAPLLVLALVGGAVPACTAADLDDLGEESTGTHARDVVEGAFINYGTVVTEPTGEVFLYLFRMANTAAAEGAFLAGDPTGLTYFDRIPLGPTTPRLDVAVRSSYATVSRTAAPGWRATWACTSLAPAS